MLNKNPAILLTSGLKCLKCEYFKIQSFTSLLPKKDTLKVPNYSYSFDSNTHRISYRLWVRIVIVFTLQRNKIENVYTWGFTTFRICAYVFGVNNTLFRY